MVCVYVCMYVCLSVYVYVCVCECVSRYEMINAAHGCDEDVNGA